MGKAGTLYNEKRKDAMIRYAKKHLKRIPLDVQNEKYEEIKAHADRHGEAVNQFIKRAINETMARDDKMENRYAMNHTPLNDNDD